MSATHTNTSLPTALYVESDFHKHTQRDSVYLRYFIYACRN